MSRGDLDRVLEQLRKLARCGRGDPALDVLPDSWCVFVDGNSDSTEEGEIRDENYTHQYKRIVYMLNALPLGRGTFGYVYPVILASLHTSGKTFYQPAAMKVAPILDGHIREMTNAVAINELLNFGCSPGFTYFFDAFTISTALDECRMPPNTWRDFWRSFDMFIYEKRHDIRHPSRYGEKAIYEVNEQDKTARVSRGYSVSFIFGELSPHHLTSHHSMNTPMKSKPILGEPVDTQKLLSDSFMLYQALSTLHMAGMMHTDISTSNVIQSTPTAQRPTLMVTPFYSEKSFLDRLKLVSIAAPNKDDIATLDLLPSLNSSEYIFPLNPLQECQRPHYRGMESRDHVVVINTPTVPLVIDFGSLMLATLDRSRSIRDSRTYFIDNHTHPELARKFPFPANIISPNSWRYPINGSRASNPIMARISNPTANIFSRPPEQLNPFVQLLPQPNETNSGALVMGVYSEFSDVFSMTVVVVSRLLGYDIFSSVVPLLIKLPHDLSVCQTAGLVVDPTNISRHRNGVCEYTIKSIFGSHFSECSPLRFHTSGDGYDLSKSNGGRHQPSSSQTEFDVTKTYFYDNYDYVRWGMLVKIRANANEPATNLYDIVYHFVREQIELGEVIKTWVHDVESYVESLVMRIEVLGIPQNLDAFKGTFLYPLFCEVARYYKNDPRIYSGWLTTYLYGILVERYHMVPIEAADLYNLLMDSLSWDPAQRPSAEYILSSTAFTPLYQKRSNYPNALNQWSAYTPTPMSWQPSTHDARKLMSVTEVEWPSKLDTYYASVLTDRRLHVDMMLTTVKVALYQHFKEHFCKLAPYLTRDSHRLLPILHPDDLEVMTVINFNTGLLDYATGKPCMNYEHVIPIIFHCDGLLAHFNNASHVDGYCMSLARQEHLRGVSVPTWIFKSAEEFKALPETALSKKLKDSYEELRSSGRSVADIAPKRSHLPHHPTNHTNSHHNNNKRKHYDSRDHGDRHNRNKMPRYENYQPGRDSRMPSRSPHKPRIGVDTYTPHSQYHTPKKRD